MRERFSSAVQAAVSLSGALGCDLKGAQNECYQPLPKLGPTLPPWLDFHGCADTIVPYGPCHAPTIDAVNTSADKPCWGSGVDTVHEIRKAGGTAYLW